MRLSKSLISLPIRDSIHLIWSRITLSRITVFYFTFSFLHASLQIILQAEVFTINSQATNFVNAIVTEGEDTMNGFSILQNNELLWCNDPTNIPGSCTVLWEKGQTSQMASSSTYSSSSNWTQTGDLAAVTATIAVTASSIPATALRPTQTNVVTTSTSKEPEVTLKVVTTVTIHEAIATASSTPSFAARTGSSLNSLSKRNDSTLAEAIEQSLDNPTCLTALRWPLETLRNTKREDIVFLNFHFWVLGMSIVAILNESLVHMLATLVTHALLTAWSIFQIISTKDFQSNFNSIITHGLCTGPSLLPDYWKQRTSVEIPAAALNGTALLLSAFLTWRLVVTYNWATFKRIGANRSVSKAYKMVLTFSVALQLSLFFIVVSMALWIDQLMNGAIGVFAILSNVYTGIYITVLILLVPWIVIGWRAVRSENRTLMAGFLLFDVLLIGGWASMFASTTFRLTFMQWRFFAVMSVVALLLTLSCLIFGIMCRMNFGNDLKRHLNGQESLPEGFVSVTPEKDRSSIYSYEEKVAFPESTLPSFPMSRVSSNASVDSQTSLGLSDSDKTSASISGPIIFPMSRFSVDSNDERAGVFDALGHQRNESEQSKSSRRWIIE